MPNTAITKKSEITDAFLLSQGQLIYDNSKTGHQLFYEQMRKDMDMYDGKFSAEERKFSEILGIPRLFIPKTYVNTQRIHVDVMESVIDDPDEIVDIRSNKAIPTEYLRVVKTLLNHRLNSHPINFYAEAYEASLNAIRNMICVMKVYPMIETEDVKESRLQEKKTDDGVPYHEYVEVTNERIKYFEPRMECVPPEDIFFSKRATWKDYWKYPLVHRYKRSKDELRRMGYKNIDDVSDQTTEDQLTDEIKYQRKQDYQTLFNDETEVRDQENVWVFECWDFLPGDGKELVSGSYVLLGDMNGPTVVGREWVENDLPYRFSPFEHNRPPFVLGEAYPEPHRLEGKSYPQITGALQRETNAQRNQEREAVARDLRRIMYVNREANVDLVALTNRRIGGYVLGDGPQAEAMGEMPTNNSAAILSRTQARTDNDYYESGLPPNLLGSGGGEETATGQTQQLSNANKKISLVIKNLAHTMFMPAFKFLLRLEQAYETEEYINKVTGQHLGWAVGSPARDAIQGDFELQVNMGMNKQSQINKLLLVMDRLVQSNQATLALLQVGALNPQQAKLGNPMLVFKELLPLVGIKKTDEFEITPQQPPIQPAEGQGSAPRQITDAGAANSSMIPSAPGMP